MNRMTTTNSTMVTCEAKIGMFTTNPCTCCRSLEDRLINWPVWARSWNPTWSPWMWANNRSRSVDSVTRLSRNAM